MSSGYIQSKRNDFFIDNFRQNYFIYYLELSSGKNKIKIKKLTHIEIPSIYSLSILKKIVFF